MVLITRFPPTTLKMSGFPLANMKIYRIAEDLDDEVEEIDLTDSNSWEQHNYRWHCGDYTIDNDNPTEQFEVYFNNQYIDTVDSFGEAMSLAEDHRNGYVDVQEKKEITPYDIIESKFGYTDDPKKAGYIMTDGRMVNLNRPHIDHRAVTADGSTKSMQEFIADGNIRLSFINGYAFFDMKVKPTYAQQKIIRSILEEASDGVEISIDVGLSGYDEARDTYYGSEQETLKRFEPYPDVNAVMGQINAFYGSGKSSQFSRFLKNKTWHKVFSSNILNNLQFILSPSAASAGHKMVYINVDKFDSLFRKESDFYIGAGGCGETIGNRYNNFKDFLDKGIPIEVSQIYIDEDMRVGFGNGRHRYAVLRDMGFDRIPVSMSDESIERAKKLGVL